MNIVKSVLTWSLLAIVGTVALAPAAQAGLLDQLVDRAKQVVKDKAENKETSTVGNATDAVLNGRPPANPNGKTPAAPDAAKGASRDSAPITAYQNYDFATGEELLFEDDFAGDETGEYAAHWNQGSAQGAVNDVAGRRVLLLSSGDNHPTTPAIRQPSYLGPSFTVEFDTLVPPGTRSGYGSAPTLKFYAKAPDARGAAVALGAIHLNENNFHHFSVGFEQALPTVELEHPQEIAAENWAGKWHHVAVAWRNKRFKVYVDQYRIYASPEVNVAPKAVAFDGGGNRENPTVLANVRIANGGAIKTVDKKFVDAKIVSRGIHFDTDRATLRPESMGAINQVAEVLRNNPELRFEVQGHTDNSGSADRNLALSQQRAEAVKAQLVAVGIAADRLTTKGLGDTQPMAGNDSFEGRAANRRVEFVRKS